MKKIFLISVLLISFQSFASIDGFKAEKINSAIINENKELVTSENHLFTLDKGKLGQKYIWGSWVEKSDGSIYGRGSITTGFSTESLTVYFKISDDEKWVQMFEIKPEGYHNGILVQDDLLDRFPIIRDDEDNIVFDFSKGLPTRFLRSWLSPDNNTKIKILYSFVHTFLNTENEISFAQLLKLDDENNSTMVLRHYFREWRNNPRFSPVKMVNAWELGFLPVTFKENAKLAIRKFDDSKKIVWYVSSNTPDAYKEYIKEGILWWNNALMGEIVEVKILAEPIAWATARKNVFQWSDKASFCGGGGAFGPSLSDPDTGEIFSAKVVFCGPSFKTFYDMYNDGSISWEEFAPKMFRWAAAHEVGHTLGLAHNFYAKLYRDPTNPEVISSSVMDYPNPFEAIKIKDLGVRDYASVNFLYLNPGRDRALSNLKTFPICTDMQTQFDPDCNHFTRGGMNAAQLRDWLLYNLENSPSKIKGGDQVILRAVAKLIFTREDRSTLPKFKKIMGYYNLTEQMWIKAAPYAGRTKDIFLNLSKDYQSYILSELVASFELLTSYEGKKAIVDILTIYKTFPAFTKLMEMKKIVEIMIVSTSSDAELASLYRLKTQLETTIKNYWN